MKKNRRTQKTWERYFFILNLSLLTKLWPGSSRESFTWFLPVTGHNVPMRTRWRLYEKKRKKNKKPVMSRLVELFTDWCYSVERWTAAASWKATANLSQDLVQGHGLLPRIRADGPNPLIVTHCPCPCRLHEPHLLKVETFSPPLPSLRPLKDSLLRGVLFVTSLYEVVQFDYLVSVIMS